MSHKNQKWIVRISRRIGIRKVICLFAIAGVAEAQQVIVQPPQYSVQPPALQEAQNNETQVFNPAAAFLNMLQEINPYKWGPVSFRPSVSYSFLYATGVQSSPGTNAATITQTISPSFLFIIGKHWSLDYTPTWTFYSGGQFQNNLSHTAMLSWGTSYEDWVLGLSQSYTRSDTPLIETGEQTKQENYATALSASYQFNDKMSLEMGLNQNLNYVANVGGSTNVFQNLADSYNWSTMEWLNYEFWPRLNAGIGAGMGYTIQQGSPDSIDEECQGRVNWRATDKISFQLSGGVEEQQYLSGGLGDLLTPTFGATIQYQPFKHTELSLNANRSVSPSLFQSQNTDSTSLTATLNQQLLGQFNLELTGGYSTTSYIATTAGFSVNRTDDNYSFTASLSHSLTKRGSISASYTYNENSSNVPGFAFSSNQIGVQIGYQF